MEVREARRARLLALLYEHDNKQTALGKTLAIAPSMVSQWINRTRTISEASARAIETKLKKPRGWMDGTEPQPRGVAEEATRLAADWPFPDVTVRQWNSLSEAARAEVQGFVKAQLALVARRRLGAPCRIIVIDFKSRRIVSEDHDR